MIYAVDFDGTICTNAWPEIGEPNVALIAFLKAEQAAGHTVILYTMREGELLDNAVQWLMSNFSFRPDEVNENAKEIRQQWGTNPRKIYADIYVDDHNAKFGICADLPFKGGEHVEN